MGIKVGFAQVWKAGCQTALWACPWHAYWSNERIVQPQLKLIEEQV